jgi:FMN reductase
VKVVVVVGNPKAMSRTRVVAEEVARQCEAALDGTIERSVIDLADLASRLFDWGAEEVAELNTTVANADLIVVASPTYKATYTGLLKAFLDRYGDKGLAGVVAVPVMMGAGPTHYLAPEVGLRPLLVELGASVPTSSLYVMESQLDDLEAVVGAWAETQAPILARTLDR